MEMLRERVKINNELNFYEFAEKNALFNQKFTILAFSC